MSKQPKIPAICASVIQLPRDLIPEPMTCVVVLSSDPLLGNAFGEGFSALFVKLTPHDLADEKKQAVTNALVIGSDIARSKVIAAYLEAIGVPPDAPPAGLKS